MRGTSAFLIDRVASLLPKTTAGACIGASPWTEYRQHCSVLGVCCSSNRNCHFSCHGQTICGSWHFGTCF